jgi:hypothetical protein
LQGLLVLLAAVAAIMLGPQMRRAEAASLPIAGPASPSAMADTLRDGQSDAGYQLAYYRRSYYGHRNYGHRYYGNRYYGHRYYGHRYGYRPYYGYPRYYGYRPHYRCRSVRVWNGHHYRVVRRCW